MSIVREFETAFNRQDVDALLACFTPDGSYVDMFFGAHAGPALRPMFERMFREGRDYAWVMDTVIETPAAAAAEWTFGYVVTDAIPRSAGRRVRFRGMSVFASRATSSTSTRASPCCSSASSRSRSPVSSPAALRFPTSSGNGGRRPPQAARG